MFTDLADRIEVLFPTNGFDWDTFAKSKLQMTFPPDAISFLEELSKNLLNHTLTGMFPDLAALGFWLRTAHIKRIIAEYEALTLIARGTVFHLAPGNVDTIFVYSLVLG